MPLHRFYTIQPIESGTDGELHERQAQQVRSVLRLARGDQIVIFDGSGAEAEAVLTTVSRGEARYEVGTVNYPGRAPSLDLTVGLALLRGDRFEIALQKLTEVGVRRVVPLTAERCVVSFRDARDWEKRAARYRRIIVEAAEQSERVTLVDLDEPASPAGFVGRYQTTALVERGQHPSIASVPLQPVMAVAVGPEGGWSESELGLLETHASTASLGSLILRAETAAIVAAGTLVQRSYASSD